MRIEKTKIEDVLILEPEVYHDERGYFYEVFNDKAFNEATENKYDFHTLQSNESWSHQHVFRGLHFQSGDYAQAKIVRCTAGVVLDFAVDLRKDSPTYGKFEYCVLSPKNHKLFFIPRGFAHGFIALKDGSVFNYFCDNYYDKKSEGGVLWSSKGITSSESDNVTLKDLLTGAELTISDKDQIFPDLDNFTSPF